MNYDNYEDTLRSFPHWYDKNPYSNFSRTIKVLDKQYWDKSHKVRTLHFANKLYKPITIHKVQNDKYVYEIIFDVMLDSIKTVNVYVNPILNDREEILDYEKCYFKEYKDDGYNNQFHFAYKGDTRRSGRTDGKIQTVNFEFDDSPINVNELTLNIKDNEGNPISGAVVSVKDVTPIIPKDTFVIEVLTYDGYRWVKGFPENDETDLFRIYQEQKSYTDYLTFEIKKQNIKNISICKDNVPIFDQDLFSKFNENNVIYHDYLANQRVNSNNGEQVIVADPVKDNYVVRVVLDNNDFEYYFDYANLKKDYPNTDEYIKEFLLDSKVVPSSETLDTLVIRKKEKNRFSAYKTVYDGEEYHFALVEDNLRHTYCLKSNYDLFITTYDKNHRNCAEYDKKIHKRYNGFDKHNYDCFTHDFSLDMLGKFWNIPRLEFNPNIYENSCEKLNVEYYMNTYPSFNDRLSEDDYSYQQRIGTYIQKYNKEHFPVLELWKSYQIWGELRNRKDILSTQNKSYMNVYPYYEDTSAIEESRNKLNIVKGVCNEVNINEHLWYESVLVDSLFVVPNSEYNFSCVFHSEELIDEETDRVSLHIYYLDKKGNCHNESVVYPLLKYKGLDEKGNHKYSIDETFVSRENSVKIDFVLESDYWFEFDNAVLVKYSIVDKDAMYMTTKTDYNSCVYDLMVDYKDVPTNIDFTNTNIFEKLLQRSLPITHKGFLNITDTFEEEVGICSSFGEINLINLCDFTNNYGSNHKAYQLEFSSFIKNDCHYRLNVTFVNNEPIQKDSDYVYTLLKYNYLMDSVDYTDYCTFHPTLGNYEFNEFREDSFALGYESILVIDFRPLVEEYGSITFTVEDMVGGLDCQYFIGGDYTNSEYIYDLYNPTFTITKRDDDYKIQFNDEWIDDYVYCDGVISLYNVIGNALMKVNIEDEGSYSELLKTEITPNTETELTHNFIPKGNEKLVVKFYTEDTEFKYKDLVISREEQIDTEELWSN